MTTNGIWKTNLVSAAFQLGIRVGLPGSTMAAVVSQLLGNAFAVAAAEIGRFVGSNPY